ncbi:helix-turn-helix domain-containing protein [Streptomyces sp. NBC_01803]|uniref:helix-turn-helix domain-containing protein n=1 Tax=Streptomyces sp. NBC_01803 TaxID=2975946 RepID=UPI002DDC1882|nr:helix-turn-helix transcriptional regulator [Streptomyces sp. NBC_01803]WSA45556.1 helix-turn-helix domain-containing protein [Streptomyces sp. NBC_01803]
MGLRGKPSQRQRRLGAELRRMREDVGLTATKAGAEVGLSAAHLNHIEAGRTSISPEKIRGLAAFCGCKQERLIESLIAMSQSNGRGWWSEYEHPPHNQAVRDLAELESMSVRLRAFQWVNVPGMLQTPEYMRALFKAGHPDMPAENREQFVEFRLRRQRLLTDPKPPEFHAVIHEAALRMEFVGREVMQRQVEHMVEMACLPHVKIQILPFRTEAYPGGFGCSFVCFDAAVAELSTVYVEHPASSPFVIDQSNLAQFSDAFANLGAVALPPIAPGAASNVSVRRDSLGLIQRLMYDL